MSEFEFGGEIAWRPSRAQIEQSNLYRQYTRLGFKTLAGFQDASTQNVAWFWDMMLRELDVQFYEPYSQSVDLSNVQFPQWCVGGKMNIVHNCLDKYIGTDKENQLAVKWEGEEGVTRALTYKQLQRQTTQMANGLRALGLKKGDAIGVYMPMTPEIVIAVLAIAKIGAVFVPLFSGYGAGAAAGVAIAKAMDLDVDQKFVNEVAENLKPNTSALFVLGSNANRAAVVNALKPYKGTLIQTTLSSELEDQLKRALSERD